MSLSVHRLAGNQVLRLVSGVAIRERYVVRGIGCAFPDQFVKEPEARATVSIQIICISSMLASQEPHVQGKVRWLCRGPQLGAHLRNQQVCPPESHWPWEVGHSATIKSPLGAT